MHAFQQLLRAKDYCDITVAEIIEQADVGKTTFYRHYDRKLDLFNELHRHFFQQLLSSFSQQQAWLSSTPNDALVGMLSFFSSESGFRRSMPYKLGNDWNLASRQLKRDLNAQIEHSLIQAFGEDAFDMEVKDLSGALAALFMEFVIQAVDDKARPGGEQKAISLQRLVRAQVHAALKPEALLLSDRSGSAPA